MSKIIVGAGEIGKSMHAALRDYHDVRIMDKHEPAGQADTLIVAFPWSEEFDDEVLRYKQGYGNPLTIILSTVPVGTSRKLGAVHSPVTGRHPFLAESIRTFTRFISGERASEAAHLFRRAGLRVQLFDNQEVTELGKLSQTTIYALLVEYVKDLKRRCDEHGLSFTEVYTELSRDYNDGYAKLGSPEYKLPLLQPILTKQGGHCTRRNCDLWETPFTDIVKRLNDV